MLKQVKTICGFCMRSGLAQIDTTEMVVILVCVCPDCYANNTRSNLSQAAQEDIATQGLATLFG